MIPILAGSARAAVATPFRLGYAPAMSLGSLAVALLLAAPPGTRHVAGVPVPETIQAGGKTLRLNGAGVRRVFVVKAYTVALYLEEPSCDAEALVASEQVKSVRLVFLVNISREDVLDEFRLGFRNNSAAELPELFRKLEQVRPILPDYVRKGVALTFVYRPGRGTAIAVKGGTSVTIPGKGFADALLRSVVGQKPYDRKLREDLLRGGS